jgi:hypothetical protein
MEKRKEAAAQAQVQTPMSTGLEKKPSEQQINGSSKSGLKHFSRNLQSTTRASSDLKNDIGRAVTPERRTARSQADLKSD